MESNFISKWNVYMTPSLSIKETSELLNLSLQRVRELCRDNELECQKVGNSWIVDEKSAIYFGIKSGHIEAKDHPANTFTDKPIALSFFSGAMGLDLGIEKSGFDVRLACEMDKFCRQTIALNKPNMALLGDVNNLTADEVRIAAGLSEDEEVDLIMGGPPCQAFSTAGKRQGFNDDRGNVFLKYIDLVLELQPKYFVIENVRGLLSSPMDHRPHDQRGEEFPPLNADELKGGALNFVLSKLKNSGYGITFNLYNSANFGTPQVRERVIIVCAKDGKKPPFLSPTHSENGEYGLPVWNTVKGCFNGIEKHDHLNFPEKRIKYYKHLSAGQNWRNLPEELQKEAMGKSYYSGGGKTGFLRRLAWDRPSPTLVTHPAMPATDLCHPDEDRPLSVQEYKRIQQFPDDWEIAGPLIQQYKQIGNAVPLGLGQAIGKLIMDLMNGVEVSPPVGFKYSRYKNTDDLSWQKVFDKSLEKLEKKDLFEQQKLAV